MAPLREYLRCLMYTPLCMAVGQVEQLHNSCLTTQTLARHGFLRPLSIMQIFCPRSCSGSMLRWAVKTRIDSWTHMVLVKKTVLDKAIDMLHRQWVIIHLQATFFTAFGKPINQFWTGLQVDIVPKGKRQNPRRPIGHRLYSRVLELEARLEAYVRDVLSAPGVKRVMDLLTSPDMKQYYQKQLVEVRKKVLAVIA